MNKQNDHDNQLEKLYQETLKQMMYYILVHIEKENYNLAHKAIATAYHTSSAGMINKSILENYSDEA